MTEIIVEIILLVLFQYPGAVIRWSISRLWRSKRTFKSFLKDDPYANLFVGLGIPFVIFALLYKQYLAGA